MATYSSSSNPRTQSLFKISFLKNPFLIISIVIVTLIHIVASYNPLFDKFLKIDPLDWSELALIIPISLLIIIVIEVEKLIRRKMSKPL